MNYVLFNGAGLILNILGIFWAVVGSAENTNDYQTFPGLMLFFFGFVFHFHWFAPIRHLFAVVCYIVFLFGASHWGEDGVMPAAFILFMGMIVHFKVWVIIIASFWAGATIARWTRG